MDQPLSDHDLAQLLIEHKLICRSEDEVHDLELLIRNVGYYRLKEYTWPYRIVLNSALNTRSSEFKKQITYKRIKGTYLFDRRLRILLIDALERFEIALKNRITQVLTQTTGMSRSHADDSIFISAGKIQAWRKEIQDAYHENQDTQVVHFKKDCGISDIDKLPLWALMSFCSFGKMKKLYEAMTDAMKPDAL